ncbi:hypothetical protein FIBSPDRAFT_952280 [Athelia psychrophila]|uniref:Uncharacterized protein n=1 Tax=Athelia psychrophila TaxID=1759441 RepID=A0A166LQL3_9AGAM|nr:hypothetical protein FIBSPDRAFT_952280 [Fibularhizoctonia sp. CBS 109695]
MLKISQPEDLTTTADLATPEDLVDTENLADTEDLATTEHIAEKEYADFECQADYTEPPQVTPISIDSGAQTPVVKSSEFYIQTMDEMAVGDGSGIAYDDVTNRDWSEDNTADTTLTRFMARAFLAAPAVEDDGDVTETGTETETATDTDGEAFYSVMTMSDNDFSSDEDDNLRVARAPRSIVGGRESAVQTPVVVYEEKGDLS